MDEATLKSLMLALDASPENTALRQLAMRGQAECNRPGEALAILKAGGADWLPDADARCLAAEIAIDAGEPDTAIDVLTENSAQELCWRARALLALGRPGEALECYDRAVDRNVAVEDVDLRQALASAAQQAEGGGDPNNVVWLRSGPAAAEPVGAPRTASLAAGITFDDIGGLDDLKQEIRRRIILPFQKPGLVQRFRKRVGGGVLLYGPPGCGKTMLARATAGECGANFICVEVAEILDMWLGRSERNLQEVFAAARQAVPAVLFFDEIEALGGRRHANNADAASRVVSQFLSEMDGMAHSNEGVLILGATNTPWAVDSAFRRPGRFDRVAFVPPPDRATRETILRRLMDQRPSAGDLGIARLAADTAWFSGADLAHLVDRAVDSAIDRSIAEGREVPITGAMLRDALTGIGATTREWLSTAEGYVQHANAAGIYDEVAVFLRQHRRDR